MSWRLCLKQVQMLKRPHLAFWVTLEWVAVRKAGFGSLAD